MTPETSYKKNQILESSVEMPKQVEQKVVIQSPKKREIKFEAKVQEQIKEVKR